MGTRKRIGNHRWRRAHSCLSALGDKRTFALQKVMSALPKADICSATRDVRFGPKADIDFARKGDEYEAANESGLYAAKSVRRLDKCLTRRANTSNLDDNVAVLCPRKVRGLRRLRVERSSGVRCKLALIPGLTASEVECPGKDCDGANLIRVPVRSVFPTG